MTSPKLKETPTDTTLTMGKVELFVEDLQMMRAFYHELVGLEILKEDKKEIELGFEGKNILTLIEKKLLNPYITEAKTRKDTRNALGNFLPIFIRSN